MNTSILVVGTLVLILLGNGVVAGVLLKRSKAENSGWMVIAAYDRRDRQRRYAVPRRLGYRSDQCKQPRRPSDHPSDPDGGPRPGWAPL